MLIFRILSLIHFTSFQHVRIKMSPNIQHISIFHQVLDEFSWCGLCIVRACWTSFTGSKVWLEFHITCYKVFLLIWLQINTNKHCRNLILIVRTVNVNVIIYRSFNKYSTVNVTVPRLLSTLQYAAVIKPWIELQHIALFSWFLH